MFVKVLHQLQDVLLGTTRGDKACFIRIDQSHFSVRLTSFSSMQLLVAVTKSNAEEGGIIGRCLLRNVTY